MEITTPTLLDVLAPRRRRAPLAVPRLPAADPAEEPTAGDPTEEDQAAEWPARGELMGLAVAAVWLLAAVLA
jgi:hypothetical protein